jgi:aerobic-type carbon monoxide dehydrogenase small subunit (CoxS/CutS family)
VAEVVATARSARALGQLVRCTGYQGIVNAVRLAAGNYR